MPVKWIAIESLADRVYTTKSDVVSSMSLKQIRLFLWLLFEQCLMKSLFVDLSGRSGSPCGRLPLGARLHIQGWKTVRFMIT